MRVSAWTLGGRRRAAPARHLRSTFPEWAERDDVLRDIRKDTIKLLLADAATKPLFSSAFIDELLQVATAREGAAA